MENEVMNAMKEAGKPVSAGEIKEITGFERNDVDKAFKNLKKNESIVSRFRCKCEPASK